MTDNFSKNYSHLSAHKILWTEIGREAAGVEPRGFPLERARYPLTGTTSISSAKAQALCSDGWT